MRVQTRVGRGYWFGWPNEKSPKWEWGGVYEKTQKMPFLKWEWGGTYEILDVNKVLTREGGRRGIFEGFCKKIDKIFQILPSPIQTAGFFEKSFFGELKARREASGGFHLDLNVGAFVHKPQVRKSRSIRESSGLSALVIKVGMCVEDLDDFVL